MPAETPQRVEREPVEVMLVREPGDPGDDIEIAKRVWDRLEGGLPTLRGRKFYGLFWPAPAAYGAAVELTEGDDPEGLGFERGTIPGGAYLRKRLHDEPPEVYSKIGAGFEELIAAGASDRSRPSVEFYRRRDQIDLLLPIKE